MTSERKSCLRAAGGATTGGEFLGRQQLDGPARLDGSVGELCSEEGGHGLDRGPVWPRRRIPIYR